MLSADKTSEPLSNATLHQRLQCERQARQQAQFVLCMLETLGATKLDNKQQELLKIAHESAETVLALINDLVDLSTIDAGHMSLEQVNFDLHEVLNKVLQRWQQRANEKNLALMLQVDPEVSRWLIGYPTRVTQILNNLVSNALKYTEKGTISIQCDALTPEGIDPTMLRFIVQDSGIGMSESVCGDVFITSELANGMATRRVPDDVGTGLTVCKQLTQLLHGEISVESTPGVGSCFIVMLPFKMGVAPVTQSVVMPQPTTDASKQHLLVVDDNETNRRVALALVEYLGFAADFACDGADAIKAVKSGNYSLVLMDCHMPMLDGFEATQVIRAWEKETDRQPIPIIAISASAYQEDRDRCTAVGMNAFIPKPVTLASLQTSLHEWLFAKPQASEKSQATVTNSIEDRFPHQLLDREQFMEMKLITGVQFKPLLEKFRIDSLLQIDAMREAVNNNSAEALRRCAHKLKGSSASIGAKALSTVCHRLEEQSRSGNIANAIQTIDTIKVCFDEVIYVIESFADQ